MLPDHGTRPDFDFSLEPDLKSKSKSGSSSLRAAGTLPLALGPWNLHAALVPLLEEAVQLTVFYQLAVAEIVDNKQLQADRQAAALAYPKKRQ